jgi:mono/diheme cytochrome c family protein
MKILVSILVVLLVLAAGVVVLAAQFDLSAMRNPGQFESRVFTAGKHWIVSRSAREHAVAEPAGSPSSLDSGGMTFNGDCAFCHGQDGKTPTDVGSAMYPRAPSLASPQVQQYSDADLFWVIRNGNRFTGMGAFGKSLSDDQIWDLVRYVRSLPDSGAAGK